MNISHITIYRFSLPMAPFSIATGTMNYAQNLLLHVHTYEGLTGVGECSAFPMIVGETQDTCLVLARDFARIWKGKNALEKENRMKELDWAIVGNNTVKSAFDMALFDLAAKSRGLPLYEYLGGHYFEPESDLTIGIGSPEKMAETAVEIVTSKKARIIKVKLGKNPEDDLLRMQKIRLAVGNDIQLRTDANQGWDFEGAVLALSGMAELNIAFCEQPMSKLLDEKMPSLRRISAIPIMADESVFTHHDAERLIKHKAFDSINIKLCKSGGILGAFKIHDICEKADMPNMLGGMLESRIALSAKVHFALACKNIQFYDLDTCLLGHLVDPVIDGVVFDGMRLKIPQLPGIGADADPYFLKNCEKFTV